jgi:hypothetical protein
MKLHRLFFLLVILITGLSSQVHADEEYWEYTFRPGDTIWSIAEQHTNSVNNWSAIQNLNNIPMGPDRQILPGTRIKIPVSMLKQQPIPAIIIAFNGNATLLRANGEQVETEIGIKLFSGDRIITAAGQSLRLQFADKSELQILPDSEVVLDKLSYHKDTGMVDTRMRLNSGHVNSWVEKLKPDSRFQIKTPSAITAVRGTQYRVISDTSGQISRTEVTEGIVGVSVGNVTKQVQQGFGLVAEKGKPLRDPVKLLEAPEISDNQASKAGSLMVSWTALEGAERYRYQLATDKDFNHVILNKFTTEQHIQLSQLSAGSVFIRVRGVDKNQLQGLDSIRSFTIREKSVIDFDDTFQRVIIPSGILMLN